MFRVEIIFLSIYWFFRKLVLPKDAVVVQRFGKRNTSDEEVIHVIQYITFYVLCLFAGTLVLTSYGNAFVDAFFEVASAIGNTGLTVGITAPGMPVVEKIVLIIEMWIGRVEIFPVLMLFFFRIRK
jgi:trk system potassium uptake protein TrkH